MATRPIDLLCTLQGTAALTPRATGDKSPPTTKFRVKVHRVRWDGHWGELIIETMLYAVVLTGDPALWFCASKLAGGRELYISGTLRPQTMANRSDTYAAATLDGLKVYPLLTGPISMPPAPEPEVEVEDDQEPVLIRTAKPRSSR